MRKRSGLFHFKQFSIDHTGSAMKVGTDGVLLGAWAHLNNAARILDIGTGSGVIAIMLAQRSATEAKIDAVEIEKQDADQAYLNVMNSPWPQKITIHHTAIQNFLPEEQYDLIISNPPYFSNSYEPPDERRIKTRHTTALTFHELLQAVLRLLNTAGTFNVVLPYTEGLAFRKMAIDSGLYCTRCWSFRGRKGKPVERFLFEFSRREGKCEEGDFALFNEGEEWSFKYRQITGPFYLKA
ncbi:MAG TPA: methyltransferase [Ohtaekwangia sp.]|nr:methyltransferase [Ohtaekwangia sp.]